MFPWVALFHLMMLVYSIWNYKEFPFPSVYWLPTLWQAAYFFCWLFVCDMRRWAGLSYIGLTAINIILHYALSYKSEIAIFTPPFLLIYILFSFFILVYYRRLQ